MSDENKALKLWEEYRKECRVSAYVSFPEWLKRLAKPEKNPVAYWTFRQGFDSCMVDVLNEAAKKNPAPLYLEPQPRKELVGLTEDQIDTLFKTTLVHSDLIRRIQEMIKGNNT